MAIPNSNENRDIVNSESIPVDFFQEHISLPSPVPCLDCELLTLLRNEIRQEHQPSDGFARSDEHPEGLHELSEASILLENACDENSVTNHAPERGNEVHDSNNLQQRNFQAPQDHLNIDAQESDQEVPRSQAEFFAGHSQSTTMGNVFIKRLTE